MMTPKQYKARAIAWDSAAAALEAILSAAMAAPKKASVPPKVQREQYAYVAGFCRCYADGCRSQAVLERKILRPSR